LESSIGVDEVTRKDVEMEAAGEQGEAKNDNVVHQEARLDGTDFTKAAPS